MFEPFLSQYQVLPVGQEPVASFFSNERLETVTGYRELMEQAAGVTFENGLYRLHSVESRELGQRALLAGYPEFDGRLELFGFDWLGTQFALDFERVVDGEPQVILLEPGSGDALEVPLAFVDFHNTELVADRGEVLASSFFVDWLRANPEQFPVAHSDCAGYRLPLSSGGSNTIENLEPTTCADYWLRCAVRREQHAVAPEVSLVEDNLDES